MANASLGNDDLEKDSLSLVDNDENEFDTDRSQSHGSGVNTQKKSSRTPRASQKELNDLRQDVRSRFESIDSKLDRFFSMMDTAGSARQPSHTSAPADKATNSTTAHRRDMMVRIPLSTLGDVNIPSLREEDTISLMPGQKERSDLLGDVASQSNSCKSHPINIDSDSDDSDDRFHKYSAQTRNLLQEIFGEDATTKSDKNTKGIELDDSQTAVLKESWRAEKPSRLSAYKDGYKSSFPISDKAEEMLNVPSIDTIVGNLLLKKYGNKFAVKAQSLCSQPLKDLEKIAYQGQHAARMGIIINAYMQQALGSLLSTLTDKQCNMDKAVQCVRDIFAMNTKSLDQMARCGALHHLVRRKSAMADTGLNESKELRNHIWDLPLSHTGVFGSGLETKLKERQEINKQISDLLPDFDRRNKRKSSGSSDQTWKRPRQEPERSRPLYPNQSYSFGAHPSRASYKPQSQPRFPKTSATKTSGPSQPFGGRVISKH